MAARPAHLEDAAPEGAGGDGAAAAHDDAPDPEARNETDMILDMVQQARGIDQGKGEIARLQEQRRVLAVQKRLLTHQLRNETRKRTRLIQRSSKLSVPDLVQSLYIRQARAQEREQRAQDRAHERHAAEQRAAGDHEVVR
jgi:hypothetical protein